MVGFNLDTIWKGKHESDVAKSQRCTPNSLAMSVTRYHVIFLRVHEMSRYALHIALYLGMGCIFQAVSTLEMEVSLAAWYLAGNN